MAIGESKMTKESGDDEAAAASAPAKGVADSNRLHDEALSASSTGEAVTSQSTAPAAEQDNTSADVSTTSSISSKNTLGK